MFRERYARLAGSHGRVLNRIRGVGEFMETRCGEYGVQFSSEALAVARQWPHTGMGFIGRRLKLPRLEMTSSSGFVDHRFPYAFGPEHEFNRFPYRSVPSEGLRRIVCSFLYFRHGIAHRNRESDTTQ